MRPTTLRKLALSLPDACETPHFERTSFRVGKKIFATMTRDGLEAMVRVPDLARVEALLEAQPAVFFEYGAWTRRNGALGVRLARVDTKLMRELVARAHESVAGKRTATKRVPK